MSDKELKPSVWIGCMSMVIHLFITGPIWYVLLFGVLTRTESPGWQWVLYWLYVPAGVIAMLITHVASVFMKQGA